MEDKQIQERAGKICTGLKELQENLQALSDDIWLSVDHNDPDALKAFYPFKTAYAQRMKEFNNLAAKMSELIQGYIQADVETENGRTARARSVTERIIKELDKEEAHTLEEDFCYKKPYGFILDTQAVKDLKH